MSRMTCGIADRGIHSPPRAPKAKYTAIVSRNAMSSPARWPMPRPSRAREYAGQVWAHRWHLATLVTPEESVGWA